jgi:AcrR family transcriptional regulator
MPSKRSSQPSRSGQPSPPRRRRADAAANSAAILDAASKVLTERPEAGLADVAGAAGVSRQTLYAHYPSRDALIRALIQRAADRVTAALDAADLGAGPADQALVRLLEVGWRSMDTDPFLLHLAAPPASADEDRERHAPIVDRLREVVLRGHRDGDIDAALSVDWVIAAVLALGHAAGEEVRAGRMSTTRALDALRVGVPRLVRPERHGRGRS